MREIKFRAWDKEQNQMVSVSDVNLTPYCLMLSLEGNLFDEAYDREDDGIVNDKFILMQFTGLHDKNGTPIYEGDIIIWGDKGAREKGTALHVTVEFKSGCFGIFDGKRFHEFYHYCADKWDDSEITYDMWGELPIEKYFRACFEVIGNIYENKELIP